MCFSSNSLLISRHTGFFRCCTETSCDRYARQCPFRSVGSNETSSFHSAVFRGTEHQSQGNPRWKAVPCPPFADPIENGNRRFVDDQSVQRDTDEEVIRACEVGKRLCLLYTQFKHQVHALTRTLYHAAEGKDLRNTSVSWGLAVQCEPNNTVHKGHATDRGGLCSFVVLEKCSKMSAFPALLWLSRTVSAEKCLKVPEKCGM